MQLYVKPLLAVTIWVWHAGRPVQVGARALAHLILLSADYLQPPPPSCPPRPPPQPPSFVQTVGASPARRSACFSCVAEQLDGYACGECAARHATDCERQQCVACLRTHPTNSWDCYAASYAPACAGAGGRRLMRAGV